MSKPGYLEIRLSTHDEQSLALIAEALGLDLKARGVAAQVVRSALHFYASTLVTPSCPDCRTALVPVLDKDGQATGRWYCPGCAD